MVKHVLRDNWQQELKITVIVAHDAYLKGAHNICRLLGEQANIQVSWFTTSKLLASHDLSYIDIEKAVREKKLNDDLVQADMVIAGLGGRDLNKLIYGIRKFVSKSYDNITFPKIIGYFPGVLHLRIFESLATRLLCDQVLLNCERDYFLYRKLALATIGKDNGLMFGAPWISPPPTTSIPQDIDLLFVEQSVVPETLRDRTSLVKCLIALARQHPSWRIVVALRARKGNASSHDLKYCLEEISQNLLAGEGGVEFVIDDIDHLIARSHRIATISSSVAYTSLAWDKETWFIRDLGVNKNWGNDLFKRSGYMVWLHQIGDLVFSKSTWCSRFVKLPCPNIINQLKYAKNNHYVDSIPCFNVTNMRLLWVVLIFCLKNFKNPLVEVRDLLVTIRNINGRIYGLKKKENINKV